MTKILYILAFILIELPLNSSNLFAQKQIFFDDTLCKIGVHYKMPLYFNGEAGMEDSIKLEFEYNSELFDIDTIEYKSNGFLISRGTFNFSIIKETNNSNNSICQIVSSLFKSETQGVICLIYFKAKTCAFSECEVKIKKFVLGNKEVADYDLKSATFKIDLPVISKTFIERIDVNIPNPFSYSTQFEFYLNDKTHPEFKIYNGAGWMSSSIPDNQGEMDFTILNDNKTKIEYKNETILEKGKYFLVLTPHPSGFASGAYYLYMKTNSSVSQVNFIYYR